MIRSESPRVLESAASTTPSPDNNLLGVLIEAIEKCEDDVEGTEKEEVSEPMPKRARKNAATDDSVVALEKLASDVVEWGGGRHQIERWRAYRFKSGGWYYLSESGKRFNTRPDVGRWLKLPGVKYPSKAPQITARMTVVTKETPKNPNTASPKLCLEALEWLASYVVQCGGSRSLINGWTARRNKSGCWCYFTDIGKRLTNRPEVARWLKLPGAPTAGMGLPLTNIGSAKECKVKLRELASYVKKCGGGRNQVRDWEAYQITSGAWCYRTDKDIRFGSRTDVVRWLELPGAPAVGMASSVNIASEQECQDALKKLALYVVECGGKKSLVKGWTIRRNNSGNWHYYTNDGKYFNSRRNVARHFDLLVAPAAYAGTNRKL